MLGGSPISVAVPCRFDEMAMPIKSGTGDAFSRLAIASPIGATIKMVATLSTNAEIPDDRAHSHSIAIPAVLERIISQSANHAGTRDLMNKFAIMDMPVKIASTFQLIALKNSTPTVINPSTGSSLKAIRVRVIQRIPIAPQTICGRLWPKSINPR